MASVFRIEKASLSFIQQSEMKIEEGSWLGGWEDDGLWQFDIWATKEDALNFHGLKEKERYVKVGRNGMLKVVKYYVQIQDKKKQDKKK